VHILSGIPETTRQQMENSNRTEYASPKEIRLTIQSMIEFVPLCKRVIEVFDYRADGMLIWRDSVGAAKAGTQAGSETCRRGFKSYRYIRLDKKLYRAHRLVFLWHHGYVPKIVDHINADTTDNRIENLRQIDSFENQWNRRNPPKGISFDKATRTWKVQIMSRGKRFFRRCKTKQEAISVERLMREMMQKIC
jgi:hypothetical protein